MTNDVNMALEDLLEAVRKRRTPPSGVKVSVDLWGELKRANESEEIDFCPIGKPDCAFPLPVLTGTTTVIWVDPDLPGCRYALPKGDDA